MTATFKVRTAESLPFERHVVRQAPKRVLVDHRPCGGGGCARCNERGTKVVLARRPTDAAMPADEAAFEAAREHCPCYEGYSINAGVSQCSHADRTDGGEWCELRLCPLVPHNAEVTGKPRTGAART